MCASPVQRDQRPNPAIVPVRRATDRTTVVEEPTHQPEKAITMAASLIIEQEQGTYVGTIRGEHQGYCSGNFTVQPSPREHE
jgi:hypothetical protein